MKSQCLPVNSASPGCSGMNAHGVGGIYVGGNFMGRPVKRHTGCVCGPGVCHISDRQVQEDEVYCSFERPPIKLVLLSILRSEALHVSCYKAACNG